MCINNHDMVEHKHSMVVQSFFPLARPPSLSSGTGQGGHRSSRLGQCRQRGSGLGQGGHRSFSLGHGGQRRPGGGSSGTWRRRWSGWQEEALTLIEMGRLSWSSIASWFYNQPHSPYRSWWTGWWRHFFPLPGLAGKIVKYWIPKIKHYTFQESTKYQS